MRPSWWGRTASTWCSWIWLTSNPALDAAMYNRQTRARSRPTSATAASPDASLRALLGNALGSKVRALAANDDQRQVRPTGRASSVGAQSALGRRESYIEDVPSELWHSIVALNLHSAYYCTREAGRHMIAQGSGAIVNTPGTWSAASAAT